MADLSDAALSEELRGLGSISERLVAAVIPDAMPDVEGHKRAVQGVYGQEWEPRPGEGLAAKINARELEERVKKELRGVMLLGERDEVRLIYFVPN
jgi:transcriptional adapter 3